ncbi:DNA adenine methylase [Legionella cardiaca]|uniref:site-specific DNA-methyltransferase (adenine-specific) n=1 Tax=Legionella cardiaca TaxID=1071983 RepID=A0ABY8AP16_9GAMM|nr:DNA adenine methylase [Legionella cardiaca]WED42375.1 DNA adenine methylase [Legionella cardiaca]
MKLSRIELSKNFGGPLHYLGNRYLSLPDVSGHMAPDDGWLNEHFSILLANNGKKYKRAIEPFAGSASWSMAAMELGIAEEYIINDSNKILITTLQLIKEKPERIKESYSLLVNKYDAATSKKASFLDVIEKYNHDTSDEEKALLLPFIINHSWGGILCYDNNLNILYREGELFEGKNAERFLEKANLSLDWFLQEVDRASNLFNINNVSFKSGDFIQVISDVAADDFVALNPPYPENERSISEGTGMYVELYSPEKLHQNLKQVIQQLEKKNIHYYMTYGFYNPKFSNYVFRDELSQPINYFRVLGYENCAFGVGLDQLYFTSQFSIPESVNIFKAEDVLKNSNITPEEALKQYEQLSKK